MTWIVQKLQAVTSCGKKFLALLDLVRIPVEGQTVPGATVKT